MRRVPSEALRIFEDYGLKYEPNDGTFVVAFDAEE
jgi:hypothetical protein